MNGPPEPEPVQPWQPGWFPDPGDPKGSMRYWDGQMWTSNVAPRGKDNQTAFILGAYILAVVGVILSFQSVSVASGTGIIWAGAAVAGAGCAVAFFLTHDGGVKVIATILTVVAISSAIYDEHQVDQRRDQIQEQLNEIGN